MPIRFQNLARHLRRRATEPLSIMFIVTVLLSISEVWALPQLGSTDLGEVRVTQSEEGVMTIHQRSPKVVIRWSSFSIEKGETVRLIQPNASAMALMLGFPPRIRGKLISNGQIFFPNVYGTIVEESGIVEVGSLLASAWPITIADFMHDYFFFEGGEDDLPPYLEGISCDGWTKASDPGYIIILGSGWRMNNRRSQLSAKPENIFTLHAILSLSQVRKILLNMKERQLIVLGLNLFLNFSFPNGGNVQINEGGIVTMSPQRNGYTSPTILNPPVNRVDTLDAASLRQGTIIHGEGEITHNDQGITRVEQFSDTLVVIWDHFSLSEGDKIRFNHPGAKGITINLLRAPGPFLLNGELLSTGQVFWVNSGGVIFGPRARTRAGGLIASGLSMDLERFYKTGTIIFSSNGSDQVGDIVHQGLTTADIPNHPQKQGPFGYVVFLGKNIQPGLGTLFPLRQIILATIDPHLEQQIELKPGAWHFYSLKREGIQTLNRIQGGTLSSIEFEYAPGRIVFLDAQGKAHYYHFHDSLLPQQFPLIEPEPTPAVDSSANTSIACEQAPPLAPEAEPVQSAEATLPSSPLPEATPSPSLPPDTTILISVPPIEPPPVEISLQTEVTEVSTTPSLPLSLPEAAGDNPSAHSIKIEHCVGCHIAVTTEENKKSQAEEKGWSEWFLRDIVSPWRFGAGVAGSTFSLAYSIYKVWPYFQHPFNRAQMARRVRTAQEAITQTPPMAPTSPPGSPSKGRNRSNTR